MRTGSKFRISEKDGPNAELTLDWKSDPKSTLNEANELLKNYGLEFIFHETESDFYAFSLVKIKARKAKKD